MWCARLTESQLELLKDLIKVQGDVGPELEQALEALEFARWDELPEAELPWADVSERATTQGISEADVIWDLSGRKKEPSVPRPKGQSKQGKRPPRRTRKPAT
jgi:hypothetical protein